MKKRKYVVDACVIFKFFLQQGEDYIEQTRALRKNYLEAGVLELLVPPLWAYELGAIVQKRVEGAKEQDEFLKMILDLRLTKITFMQSDYRGILKLSRKFATSYYDTSYLYAAIMNNCSFITADEKFMSKVKSSRVIHIRNY
ncbi:MAG: type II toxin-antitoxin system VapC family toxin [bacterium]|nr:type II toxin-antitoxin system VapC family toxin [bacterium]